MPRLVRLTATGSIKIGPTDKPISICACGLSRTFPICDGTHKQARLAETDPNALYVYDPDRRTIIETRVDVPPPPEPPPTPASTFATQPPPAP
ncbi:MAG TPA: CDGSH iron-sulfur domain-containing protein [Phycisphaerales bacterium]|nr:CDGSH iron-sulfur domain-containing protein [Phycisphaerales bacterium]